MKLITSIPITTLLAIGTTFSSIAYAEDRTVTINVSENTIYNIKSVKGFQSVVTKEGLVKTRIIFTQKFVLRPADISSVKKGV